MRLRLWCSIGPWNISPLLWPRFVTPPTRGFLAPPGETDEGPTVFELESPPVDGAQIRGETSERSVEPRLHLRSSFRGVRDSAPDHGVARNLPDEFIEGTFGHHGDQARSRVDSVGTQRRLRENPGPGRLSAEVRVSSFDLCCDVDVSDPGPPDLRFREKVFEDHRGVHRDDESRPDLLTREQGQQQVASDERSLAIDRDHPVPVSIVGDPEIRSTRANRRP